MTIRRHVLAALTLATLAAVLLFALWAAKFSSEQGWRAYAVIHLWRDAALKADALRPVQPSRSPRHAPTAPAARISPTGAKS